MKFGSSEIRRHGNNFFKSTCCHTFDLYHLPVCIVTASCLDDASRPSVLQHGFEAKFDAYDGNLEEKKCAMVGRVVSHDISIYPL